MLSSPDPLWGLKFFSNLVTPSSVIWISCIVSNFNFMLQVFLKNSSDISVLFENAIWNCLFRMLALSLESGCSIPSALSGGMVLLSDLLYLIYIQNRFMQFPFPALSSTLGVTMPSTYYQYAFLSCSGFHVSASCIYFCLLSSLISYFSYNFGLSYESVSLDLYLSIGIHLWFLLFYGVCCSWCYCPNWSENKSTWSSLIHQCFSYSLFHCK